MLSNLKYVMKLHIYIPKLSSHFMVNAYFALHFVRHLILKEIFFVRFVEACKYKIPTLIIRPIFKHGPQGGILKKIEIEVWYAGKKGCPQERNLREIYTENNVGTTAQQSFLIMMLLALEGAEAIAYWQPA
jgi:hypothetical protein